MKTTIKLCASLLFSFFVLELQAGNVDSLSAKEVARNFYFEKSNISKSVSYESISLSHVMSEIEDGMVLYHVYNLTNGKGFIIISGDDRTVPVIGYSFESSFKFSNDFPPAFSEWMNARAEEIKSLKSSPDIAGYSRNPQWDKYLIKPVVSLNAYTMTDVSPLISSNWNQGCGYNADCPEDASGACGHVYAGCVATAMAQVMRYHSYPPSGTGSYSWTSSTYGEISADFGSTTYDWAGMPVPSGAYDDDVEQLLFHCGVSVRMNYSPTGSGAYASTATNSLIKYFNYSSNAVYTNKSGYADSIWAELMIKECDAKRPVLYVGYGSGGHAFNLDGYQGTDYFHFNWGWGGSYNGYFYLDDLSPGSSDFSNSQAAAVGIEPPDSFPGLDCSGAIPLTCSTPYSGTTIGATNIVNHYGNCYLDATGPEVVHTFTTTMPGRISVVVNSSANLGVYLLNDASEDSLVSYSSNSLIYDNSLPGTYYLVLDGTNGAEGDYTVTVNCPTIDADLIFLSANVTPNYVESFQSNVHLNCEIKNIGNSTAGDNEIKYYFSSDNIIDGGDILIDSTEFLSTSPNESRHVSKTVTMPGGLTPGMYYIIFQADADSVVVESDESLNTSLGYVEVPVAGIMDCSSAVDLTSGIRYYGNTSVYGSANIQDYSWAFGLDDKEVIHKLMAPYSGLAKIEFSERINGEMYLIAVPTCNENTCIWSQAIWTMADTLINGTMPVNGGTEYYFITDGKSGVTGDYSLMVTMPDSCPSVEINHWGELDRCIGSGSPTLQTDWGMNQYQWYRNGIKIDGATSSGYLPVVDGEYWVEATENGCTTASDHLVVTYSPEPDTAHISALGDTTFCQGNSVDLELYTLGGYTINWAIDGEPVSGATSDTYTATETGIYTAQVMNISCTISSNPIEVISYPLPVEPGTALPVPDTGLISYFEFDGNYTDLSGNNNWNYPQNGVTVDDNRFGEYSEAYNFDGSDDYVYTSKQFTDPDEFTLSFWFKTNTTNGGRLAGFGDAFVNQSTVSDRQVYMSDDGHLHFGVNNGSPQTISSAAAFNDGIWHHVAACLSSNGIKLFVDGVLADSNSSVINGGNYSGYWRFAYDTIMPGYADIPASNHFEGLLDEVRIYSWELLPGEIQTLYDDQILTAALTVDEVCEGPGSTDIVIENSQPGVEYQLRDNSDNSLIGSAVTGTGETIYLPAGVLSSTTTFNILATPLASGCGNVLDSLFVFTVHELPVVLLGPDMTACDDTILEDLSGGNYPAYNWSTGESTSQVTVTGDGTYALTVTDSNGCVNGDTVQVVINEVPSAIINTTDTDCGQANGSAIVVASGGTGTYSYMWDSTIVDYSGANASNLSGGTYNVTVYDSNCSVTKIFSILENGMPDMSVTVSQDTICLGDLSHIQMTGADSYNWSPTEGTSVAGSDEFYAAPDTTTLYYVSGNANGCTDVDTVLISVKENPEINLGPDTVVCDVSFLIDAGAGFDTYLWSDGSTGQSMTGDTTGIGYGVTEYYVRVTSNGCQGTDTIKVTYDECSSMEQNYTENKWKYYPNPTSGMVTFKFSEEINTSVRIVISDIDGKIIKDLKLPVSSGSKIETDLTNYENELFLIRIITKDKVFTGKLVKQ